MRKIIILALVFSLIYSSVSVSAAFSRCSNNTALYYGGAIDHFENTPLSGFWNTTSGNITYQTFWKDDGNYSANGSVGHSFQHNFGSDFDTANHQYVFAVTYVMGSEANGARTLWIENVAQTNVIGIGLPMANGNYNFFCQTGGYTSGDAVVSGTVVEYKIILNNSGSFFFLNNSLKRQCVDKSGFSQVRLVTGGATMPTPFDTFYAVQDMQTCPPGPEVDPLPVISNSVNFTSDGSQTCGYNGATYTLCGPTEDGTPTFRFNTTGNVACKIWNESKNWTGLNNQGVPDCGTTGGAIHICTYSEALPNGTNTLYISCKSGIWEIYNFSQYPSNKLNISILPRISSSQVIANEALELGITKSAIWPGALIFTFQPVYVRTKNNSQAFATFDKVAVYGNQRWGFNYRIDNESSIGRFYNITPVFYYWESANLSFYEVTRQVTTLINTTKN